jgi:dihydropteroate synthase
LTDTTGLARLAEADRCLVIGVVNVTPDSFSDGGNYVDADAAIKHGLALVEEGADIIDVGGESTRPGASRVPEDEERRRVVPVIAALASAGVPVSVDTMRAPTALAALEAGAALVNDVSGGQADAGLPRVVAEAGVPYVVMHWRAHSDRMQQYAEYDDVVGEVRAELLARVEAVTGAGVRPEQIIVDPGIGFAKTAAHNWALLHALPEITGVAGPGWGFPVLVGASRKRFLGALLADSAGLRPPDGRDAATTAISALAAAAGAWGVRVHEASASLDAVRVAATMAGHGPVGSLAPRGTTEVRRG